MYRYNSKLPEIKLIIIINFLERERSVGRIKDKPVISPDTVATTPLILEKNLIKNHLQLINIKIRTKVHAILW